MAKQVYRAAMLLVAVVLSACTKKFETRGQMHQAGIMLSFDDTYIDNWYSNLHLLDSAGAKATFYISQYRKLSPDQKAKLLEIQNHGNEIAYHTVNHYNLQDYVYKQKHTTDEMIRNEIEPGLKMMNRDGIFPTTFAYPYGAHNSVFDKLLMRYFKSVRALNGTMDFSKSIVPTEKNDVLYGLGIDKSSKRKDSDILNMLASAKNNSACAVLVAHEMNCDNKYSVTKKRLLQIFQYVKENNMRYYTASEISR